MLRKFDRKKNHGLYVSLKLFQPFVKFPHRIQKASHAVRTLRSIDGAHNFDGNDSLWFFFVCLNMCSSTSVSSPGETMPRSDSADSQSQAIQEEPLPSTSNEEEDPLAGKVLCYFCNC